MNANMYGDLINIDNKEVFVRLKGKGKPVVIIEPGLGVPSTEWWHIQDQLSEYCTVLTYDRLGYGFSEVSPNKRTSENIIKELDNILHVLELDGPYILVAHSQGGLYAQHFMRKYSKRVVGGVFLDPLTTKDYLFEEKLSPKIYKGSGVNKLRGIKQMKLFNGLGLTSLLKPLLLKSPPFFYYKHIHENVIEVLWRHFKQKKAAITAEKEYIEAQNKMNNEKLKKSGVFPQVPITVIHHSPKVIIDEIVQYGGLTEDEASQVESLWQQLIQEEYLTLSEKSKWVEARNSGHMIHLDEENLLIESVLELLESSHSMDAV